MARPHKVGIAPRDIPPDAIATLSALADLQALPPIDGPKPWTDDLERAWVYKTACGTPPDVAGIALGVNPSSVRDWLSDEPPPTYGRACAALLVRLKQGEAVAHDEALGSVRAAWGKQWQSAAWFLERKHAYIVRQEQSQGPSIVVNIGRLEVHNQATGRDVPLRHRISEGGSDAIEVTAIPASTTPG